MRTLEDAIRNLVLIALVGACALSLAVPAFAEQSAPAKGTASADAELARQLEQIPTGDAGVKLVLDDLTEKLTLTPEQIEQVRPIIAESVDKMGQAKQRFQDGEITAMAMGMQIQMASQRASMMIDPLLDESQKKVHAELRQEQKKRLMEEMAKRRAQMGM